jgi:hypothetical protein
MNTSGNDALLEKFENLRLLDVFPMERMDERVFVAFYAACRKAFEEYIPSCVPRVGSSSEPNMDWFDYISEKWSELLKLLEADPRMSLKDIES